MTLKEFLKEEWVDELIPRWGSTSKPIYKIPLREKDKVDLSKNTYGNRFIVDGRKGSQNVFFFDVDILHVDAVKTLKSNNQSIPYGEDKLPIIFGEVDKNYKFKGSSSLDMFLEEALVNKKTEELMRKTIFNREGGWDFANIYIHGLNSAIEKMKKRLDKK